LRLALICVLCLVLAYLAGCGTPSQTIATPTNTSVVSVEGDYIGEIPSLNATIAITTDGATAVVYLTDGSPVHATVSLWIQGQIANNILNLTSASTVTFPSTSPTKVTVSALVTPGDVSGSVTLSATFQTSNFTASALTTSQGAPGLYQGSLQAQAASYLGGWYALPPTAAGAEQEGGAISNETTGAVLPSPTPDFTSMTVTVPGLGVFSIHRCHFGRCG